MNKMIALMAVASVLLMVLAGCAGITDPTTTPTTPTTEQTAEPTAEPTTEPTTEPSTEPTAEGDVSLDKICDAVKKALGETYFGGDPISRDMFLGMFTVSGEAVESVIAEGFGFDTKLDSFVAVKSVAGKADEVEEARVAWRKFQIEEAFQYPLTVAKVQGAQIVRHDDFVILIMFGPAVIDDEADAEEQLAAVMAENRRPSRR